MQPSTIGLPRLYILFLAVFAGILPLFFPSSIRAGKKRSHGWRTDLSFPMLQRLPPSWSRGTRHVPLTGRGTNTTFSISLNMLKKTDHLQKALDWFHWPSNWNCELLNVKSWPHGVGRLRWDGVVEGRLQVMFYTGSLIVLARMSKWLIELKCFLSSNTDLKWGRKVQQSYL